MKLFIKKITSMLLIAVIAVGISACSPEKEPVEPPVETPAEKPIETPEASEPSTPINIAVLKGPTGMGMAKLIEDTASQDNPTYTFSAHSSPDELVGKIINKEIDIAALPTNLASVIYNKTEGQIQLVAVNTLGVLQLLDSTGTIKDVEDLRGKSISASGKGTVAEYALTYILKSNGIDPEKDITIDYSLAHEELSAAVASGDVGIALLPQPHATTAIMKNQDVKIALDLTEEWDKLDSKSQLAMGCIVANKGFLEANKERVDTFLEAYASSVSWVNQNPESAGELVEKYEILGNKTVAAKAIPYSSIVYVDGEDAKDMLQGFFQVLFDLNPKALGGKLPDDAFYYKK